VVNPLFMVSPLSRRISACVVVAAFLLFPTVLSAQIYPRTEELDRITLSDGTVLTGIITERVPDKYLQIELYGGSSFVLGFDQIESIDRVANPDYSPMWIKVDLAEMEAMAASAAETAAAPGADDGKRSLREGGITVGVYGGSGPGWYGGSDAAPDVNGNIDTWYLQQFSVGGFIRAVGQPNALSGSSWLWGIRAGIGYAGRYGGFYAEDPFGVGDLEYQEFTDVVTLPLEFLFGPAGDRVALFGGIGPGVASLTYGPEYEVNFKGTGEFDAFGEYETDTDVVPTLTASLNGVVRLGENWEADLRVAYERQLIPWDSDREVYHNAIDITLGIGYHF